MDAQIAIDLVREWVFRALMLSLPVLLSGVAIGLFLGLFQALTQIQEQTIAIVMKIVVMVLVGALLMPWIVIHFTEHATDLYQSIPEYITPSY